VRRLALVPLALLVLVLAGCGGDGNGEEESEGSGVVQAACTGSALSDAPNLPAGFPSFEAATFTEQKTQGPTEIVEGYYEGDIEDAYNTVKDGLENAGFTILFDELEEDDSEVSWKGQGRSGQVALRNECGDADRVYIRISNRPE
jgi:hypothetical protein